MKAALRTSLLGRWITPRGRPGRCGSRLASDGRAMADQGGSIGKVWRGAGGGLRGIGDGNDWKGTDRTSENFPT